ncbi:hypothetical protein V491_00664 [Pseudogymnoascus sp. VKM F-3775]|nr:hypothetical protein V491_00664 [Pseudogymnoascus sp. VKM F-3775]
MNATGPQILVAFEQRVAQDKAAKAIGTARVRIDHLAFPNPIRGRDEKIIKQLEGTFAAEGCLDEQHRIPAVIDDSTLQAALLKTGENIEYLQRVSGQPQRLHFPENIKLECLHGRHRILAAKSYLDPEEQWWTVDFYRTGEVLYETYRFILTQPDLDDDTRHSLLGGHGYSSNYTGGEIFRQLRRCQVAGDKLGEEQLRARLSNTMKRDLKQLLKRDIILNALDTLLPIRGLWKEFHLGSLHVLLHMRIDEEIAHYIHRIEQIWNEILGGDTHLMERTDEATVGKIQLLAPAVSKYDHGFIQESMAAASPGLLFPQIHEVSKRRGIASRLLCISHRIPSIQSLFKDLRYLCPAVNAIRCLLPKPTTNKTNNPLLQTKTTSGENEKTLRQKLYNHFEKSGSTLQIQNSERTYLTYTGNNQSLFDLAIRQLYLLSIRHFAKPLSQREEAYSKFILAEFAKSQGFYSDEINAILMDDPFQKLALDLLRRTLPIQKPAHCNVEIQSLATKIRDSMNKLGSSAVEGSKPQLTVAGWGVPIARRCGQEVWNDNVDSEDLKHIFLEKMHLPLADLQRGGEGMSSFYVKQSIYLAFWGPLDQLGHASASLTAAQETGNAPLYESTSSDAARPNVEDLAEQMDDTTQRQDIPNDSAPEATTSDSHLPSYLHQQVVKFVEEGVIVHETPFLKDAVNEQALRIVDSGKLLSTAQGAYFLWRNCFDMLVRTGTAIVLIKPASYLSDHRAELKRRREQSERDRELQRRREQSEKDRELQRRREQSARDRRNHQTQLAVQQQLVRRLLRVTVSHICDTAVNNPAPSTNPFVWTASSHAMVNASSSEKSGREFDRLFNNEKYSDVTLLIGESKTSFPAHRLVLGTRSPYFDVALQSKFKEASTGEFVFDKESPHALWRALQYMYTGDYTDDSSPSLSSEGDDLELLKHLRVYALADMFQIENLKTIACKKFQQQLQHHWISDTFVDCIREVYMTSRDSDATRKAVVNVVSSHQELVKKQPFQDLIREVGDFAVDLIIAMATGF